MHRWFYQGSIGIAQPNNKKRCSQISAGFFERSCGKVLAPFLADSQKLAVSAQIGSGVVRSGSGFWKGFQRVPLQKRLDRKVLNVG